MFLSARFANQSSDFWTNTENKLQFQVDAHNIVPVWVASDKQEVGARTIRKKIHNNLKEYLTEFPPVIKHPHSAATKAEVLQYLELIDQVC